MDSTSEKPRPVFVMERYRRISGMDRSFDIEYWQRLGAAASFDAAWQMTVDAHGRGATERDHGAEPLDHTAVEWERRRPMSQVTFSIPDEILLALKATPEILAARIRIAAAVKLYEMGQLSSGAASQLAGVPRPYFLGHLADYGVNTFDLSEEELIHDLKSA